MLALSRNPNVLRLRRGDQGLLGSRKAPEARDTSLLTFRLKVQGPARARGRDSKSQSHQTLLTTLSTFDTNKKSQSFSTSALQHFPTLLSVAEAPARSRFLLGLPASL